MADAYMELDARLYRSVLLPAAPNAFHLRWLEEPTWIPDDARI